MKKNRFIPEAVGKRILVSRILQEAIELPPGQSTAILAEETRPFSIAEMEALSRAFRNLENECGLIADRFYNAASFGQNYGGSFGNPVQPGPLSAPLTSREEIELEVLMAVRDGYNTIRQIARNFALDLPESNRESKARKDIARALNTLILKGIVRRKKRILEEGSRVYAYELAT